MIYLLLFLWLVGVVFTACLTARWMWGDTEIVGLDWVLLLFVLGCCCVLWPIILLGVVLARSEYGA